ncbi:MAG: helix-turn-helix domain-containing protein [Pirellulaceae bacterium]|nr:helix-turn-helix domain-containing protein [Planctomycetales bacterium]
MSTGTQNSSVDGDKDGVGDFQQVTEDTGVPLGDARLPSFEGMLTPPEVARVFKVKPHKVLAWIQSGELRAINVATKIGGRPRYRIAVEDLRAFAAGRAAGPQPTVRRSPRRARGNDFEKYF